MNINRHNYEDFFLLYVDKELTAPQLTEVEFFLQQNPDLRQELEMLQQVVLSENSDIKFPNKDLLYKAEQGINHQNHEEYFLLYVDNELKDAEKQEVEKFVLQHPSLQESFTLLRAIKLEPETIVFKDKASLYRREQGERVIPLNWLRVAAAAAVTGLIALLWFNGSDNEKAVDHNVVRQTVRPEESTFDVNKPAIGGKQELARRNEQSSGTRNADRELKQSPSVVPLVKTNAAYKTKKSIELFETKKANDKPVYAEEKNSLAVVQNIATEDNRKNAVSDRQDVKNSIPTSSGPIAVSGIDRNNIPVREAVYHEALEEDDRSIYIGGAEINRNKLRGLFKKAAGIFERKVKKADEDNTVQIASFEIKTK